MGIIYGVSRTRSSSFPPFPLLLQASMEAQQEASISLEAMSDKTQLKKLNAVLFSIRYTDRFYSEAAASGEFTKLAYFNGKCVGSIACRLDKEGDAVRVYIMTLGVLAPYRGLGIGTRLLKHVIDLSSKQKMSCLYLHVHTNNEDAINFYEKFGFKITETIKNYYPRLTPPDCYVLTKFVTEHQTNM